MVYAVVAVICWSFGAYFCCLLSEVPVLQILAMAQIAGALSMMIFKGRPPSGRELTMRLRTGWPFVCLLICNQICYVYAFRSAPAAHVDLINYTWPVLLVIGQSLKTKTQLTTRQILGTVVCFLGLMVLFLPKLLETSTQINYLPGYLAAALATVCWMLYSLLGKPESSSSDATQSTSNDILLSGVSLSILHTLTGTWTLPQVSDCLVIAALAIIYYGLAFPSWKRSIEFGHYSISGGVANAIPVLSIAWLVVGGIVPMSHTLWLATLLVSFGCYLLSLPYAKEKAKSKALKMHFANSKKTPTSTAARVAKSA